MSFGHAEKATKTMIKADPTVDENGICRGFAIEVIYALDGYKRPYRCEIEDRELADKPPSEFSEAELWALCPTNKWDRIYDSQYESVVRAPAAPVRTKITNFDMGTLKPDPA